MYVYRCDVVRRRRCPMDSGDDGDNDDGFFVKEVLVSSGQQWSEKNVVSESTQLDTLND